MTSFKPYPDNWHSVKQTGVNALRSENSHNFDIIRQFYIKIGNTTATVQDQPKNKYQTSFVDARKWAK